MPNWCDNKIKIAGPEADLRAFMQATEVDGTDEHGCTTRNASLMERLIPMPAILHGTTFPVPDSPDPHPNWDAMLASGEMEQKWYDYLVETHREDYHKAQEAIKTTGYASWWDWQITNWGVKWGDSDTYLYMIASSPVEAAGIVGHFVTPWGPPVQGMVRISTQFPTLTFTIIWTEEGGSQGNLLVHEGKLLKNVEMDWEGNFISL